MRGKAAIVFANDIPIRITPAYAGKRLCLQILPTLVKDHPRLCGEKHLLLYLSAQQQGSPPPMRGKVERVYFAPQDLRITPAYAGKSKWFAIECVKPWDHPRLCGEKRLEQRKKAIEKGSPPPMRGKGITDEIC